MFRVNVFGLVLALLALVCSLPLGAQNAVAKGKKFALLVGVTEYDHASLTALKYTENDAEKLAKVLQNGGYEVRVLTTSRGKKGEADAPTVANIRRALAQLLQNRKKPDTVLVALSGHGVQLNVEDPDGKGEERTYGFFCPSDADLKGVSYSTGKSRTLLNVDNLLEELGSCGAGVKLVLMDACRNELKAQGVERSGLDARSVKIPEGVAVMFSCSSKQKAFETEGLEHGVFFYHVLQGLRGAEAKDKKGNVTWTSLAEYVVDSVSEYVPREVRGGAKQTPHQVTNIPGSSPVLIAAAPIPTPGGDQGGSGGTPGSNEGGEKKMPFGRAAGTFTDEKVKEMSKEDARRNQNQMLSEILGEYPRTIQAKLAARIEASDYDTDTNELKFKVAVLPDVKAYDKYLDRLRLRLNKVALTTIRLPKGFRGLPADLAFHLPSKSQKGYGVHDVREQKFHGADLSRTQADVWNFWLLEIASADFGTTRWSNFLLDADIVKVLRGIHGELSCQVDLLDEDGKKVIDETFSMNEWRNITGSWQPWLGELLMVTRAGGVHNGSQTSLLSAASAKLAITNADTYGVYLAPVAFGGFDHIHGWFYYAPVRVYERKLSLTPAEFKKVKDVRTTLVFKPTKPKE